MIESKSKIYAELLEKIGLKSLPSSVFLNSEA